MDDGKNDGDDNDDVDDVDDNANVRPGLEEHGSVDFATRFSAHMEPFSNGTGDE